MKYHLSFFYSEKKVMPAIVLLTIIMYFGFAASFYLY